MLHIILNTGQYGNKKGQGLFKNAVPFFLSTRLFKSLV